MQDRLQAQAAEIKQLQAELQKGPGGGKATSRGAEGGRLTRRSPGSYCRRPRPFRARPRPALGAAESGRERDSDSMLGSGRLRLFKP